MLVVFVVVVLIIIVSISFKYPQVSLALFLLASPLKSLLVFKIGFFRVVDVTVLTAILLLITMGYNFIKSGGRMRDIAGLPVLAYLLLAALLLLGVVHTSAPNYGFEKSTRFATLTFIAFLAPVLFAHSLKEVKRLIWILIIVGTVFCIGMIIAPRAAVLQVALGRAGFLETNALATAVQIGIASIIAFVFVIMAHTSMRLRITGLAFILLTVVGVIITGSRGPFLGLVFTWLIAILVCRRGASKAWLPPIIIIIYIAMAVSFIKLPGSFTQRISRMWESAYTAKVSAHTRTNLFSWTIPRSFERPIFGHGTGAFAVDYAGRDERAYPHNIILELLYEQGLFGVVIGSLFLWLIFRRWRQASKFVYLYGLDIDVFMVVHIGGLLFLFTLLQAMKSGDIDANRIMFLCAGLVVATFNAIRRMVEEIPLEDEIIPGDWQESEELEFQDAHVLC